MVRSWLGASSLLTRRRCGGQNLHIVCCHSPPFGHPKRSAIFPSFLLLRHRTRASSSFASQNAWAVDPVSGCVESSLVTHTFQVIVGLEIHAQLNIPTKLFSPAPAPSSSSVHHNIPANSRVHPFDAAVPGTLPVLSRAAGRAAVLAAAALQCQTIRTVSRFERKHYAYADLPHGYQITQQRWPLAVDGVIECGSSNSSSKTSKPIRCRVNRIQMEIDTGKTTTTTTTSTTEDESETGETKTMLVLEETVSRVDLNRAGSALIEIVTEPDLRSAAEAAAAVRTVRQLLRHTNSCRGRMEAGQLRVDCNVNVIETTNSNNNDKRRRSPRVEVKNLNSIQQVQDAINYEARRHAELLLQQEQKQQEDEYPPPSHAAAETRTWNVALQKTVLLRVKDGEEDYRFLPEPDLPPLVLNERTLGVPTVQEFVQQNLPELPAAAVERLQTDYGLSAALARAVASDPPAIAFLDRAVAVVLRSLLNNDNHHCETSGSDDDRRRTAKKQRSVVTRASTKVANLLCNELMALIKEQHEQHLIIGGDTTVTCDADLDDMVSVQNSNVSAEQLGELVLLLEEGRISNMMAKALLTLLYKEYPSPPPPHMDDNGGRDRCYVSPRQIAQERGFELVTDTDRLRELCRSVLAEHPDLLDVYRRGGKFVPKMQTVLTGKVMAASRGNAHPERLREVLFECLREQQEGAAGS